MALTKDLRHYRGILWFLFTHFHHIGMEEQKNKGVKNKMKILQKGDEPIVECNNCKGKMPLKIEDEGGLMLFICEDCGTNMTDLDGYVEWTYPKKYNKEKFKEENLEDYYEE